MSSWLQQQIASGFADFRGLVLSGRVPVRQQVMNDLLTDFLRSRSEPADTPTPVRTDAPDLKSFLRFVRKASVQVETGVVNVDFEIRVD